MALPDLTGQNIQDTYQRVLQKSSSGEIADGTGSLFIPPTASFAISASYAASSSYEIEYEVSSSYAQTSSYASEFYVENHITASGNISSSGNLIASQSLTFGAATTEIIAQEELQIKGAASTNDYLKLNDNAIHAYIDGAAIFTIQNTHSGGGGEGSIVFNASNKDVDVKMMHDDSIQALKIDASHNRVFLRDYVTIGSGSAPAGEPNALYVEGSQYNNGHITSSGNISSSGNLTVSQSIEFGAAVSKIVGDRIDFVGGSSANDYIKLNNDNIDFFINGSEVISCEDTQILFNASGQNIDIKLMYDDGTNALLTNAANNRIKLRDYVTIGSGSVPSADPNTLLVSGSTYFAGHITASGAISSSGLISAENFHVPGQGRISFDNTDTDDQFIKGLDNSIIIDGDDTVRLKADNYVEFVDNSNNAQVSIDGNNGHITASGNISSSGNLIGTINGGYF